MAGCQVWPLHALGRLLDSLAVESGFNGKSRFRLTSMQNLPISFIPITLILEAWAALAKEAGMKYTVLTARHHDGFALFDDPDSNFTAVKSAAHHDFVADYVLRCARLGFMSGCITRRSTGAIRAFSFPASTGPTPRSCARSIIAN